MENTHTNSGIGISGAAHSTAGRITAPTHNTTAKPENRTIYWVVGGVLLLAVVLWMTLGNNDRSGQDGMDRRTSGQMAPGNSRP